MLIHLVMPLMIKEGIKEYIENLNEVQKLLLNRSRKWGGIPILSRTPWSTCIPFYCR
ncbi:MAG: hypothetical protein ACJ0FI_01940 [Gammaproteobacteria bacterium]